MKTLSVLLLAILCSGCGGYKSPNQMPQVGILPILSSMMPNNVSAGASAFTLTVNGNNFNTNAIVNWNGAQQPTRFVTPNQLTTAISGSAVATSGTVAVTVTNPGSSTPGGPYGGGGITLSETSTSLTFTIN